MRLQRALVATAFCVLLANCSEPSATDPAGDALGTTTLNRPLRSAHGRLRTIARIEGHGDPSTGELWMRAWSPEEPTAQPGVAVTAQALSSTDSGYCALKVKNDGVANNNPPGTFEFYTQGNVDPMVASSFDVPTCFGHLPMSEQDAGHNTIFNSAGVGCAYQHVGNFTGQTYEHVYFDIDTFNGDLVAHAPYGSPFTLDAVSTPAGRDAPDQALGLWDFGHLGPGEMTEIWVYFKNGNSTNFDWTGNLVGEVFENCGPSGTGDGVDDDCDGVKDNGCGIVLAGGNCYANSDCHTGNCQGAVLNSNFGNGGGSLTQDVPGTCQATCGDAFPEGAEECDDGNQTNGDTCDTNCTTPRCGNGIRTGSEACDDGNLTNGDGCDTNCTVSACGNGVKGGSEACDDGNLTDGDGCDHDCSLTACGNGIRTGGEACDDGNAIDGDGCDHDCSISACGNGIKAGGEACDDGNGVDGDGCDRNCTVTACRNNVVTPGTGEQCDDGNAVDGDGCDHDCTLTACGNGIATPASDEQCDDGNFVDGDGCDSNCTATGCGNTIVTGGEYCDDGNAINGDGCDIDCGPSICGNGILTPNAGEVCDDGNNVDGDGCDTNCTPSACGNGIVAGRRGLRRRQLRRRRRLRPRLHADRLRQRHRHLRRSVRRRQLVDGDGCDHDCTVDRLRQRHPDGRRGSATTATSSTATAATTTARSPPAATAS